MKNNRLRGRPEDTDVKAHLLKEGVQLFVRKGFRGTTVEDITDAVNLTKGAFYWHFKSKNELLESVIEKYERECIDGLIKAMKKVRGTFVTKFNQYHKYITEFAFYNRDLCVGFMTLSAELAGSGTDVEKNINAVYAKYRGFIKDLVELGKKEEIVKRDLDSDVAVHVIVAINNGMLLEWYMNQNAIDGQTLAKTYRDITLRGILKQVPAVKSAA